MTYSGMIERAALIGGLRTLADYLESSPDVPAPIYTQVYTFPPDGDWPVMQAEIDATADRLGVNAAMTPGGHYVAARSFGPIDYRAVAIPRNYDAETE